MSRKWNHEYTAHSTQMCHNACDGTKSVATKLKRERIIQWSTHAITASKKDTHLLEKCRSGILVTKKKKPTPYHENISKNSLTTFSIKNTGVMHSQ